MISFDLMVHTSSSSQRTCETKGVIKADREFLYFRIRYDVNWVECGRKPALKPSILQLRRMAHLSGSGTWNFQASAQDSLLKKKAWQLRQSLSQATTALITVCANIYDI